MASICLVVAQRVGAGGKGGHRALSPTVLSPCCKRSRRWLGPRGDVFLLRVRLKLAASEDLEEHIRKQLQSSDLVYVSTRSS